MDPRRGVAADNVPWGGGDDKNPRESGAISLTVSHLQLDEDVRARAFQLDTIL